MLRQTRRGGRRAPCTRGAELEVRRPKIDVHADEGHAPRSELRAGAALAPSADAPRDRQRTRRASAFPGGVPAACAFAARRRRRRGARAPPASSAARAAATRPAENGHRVASLARARPRWGWAAPRLGSRRRERLFLEVDPAGIDAPSAAACAVEPHCQEVRRVHGSAAARLLMRSSTPRRSTEAPGRAHAAPHALGRRRRRFPRAPRARAGSRSRRSRRREAVRRRTRKCPCAARVAVHDRPLGSSAGRARVTTDRARVITRWRSTPSALAVLRSQSRAPPAAASDATDESLDAALAGVALLPTGVGAVRDAGGGRRPPASYTAARAQGRVERRRAPARGAAEATAACADGGGTCRTTDGAPAVGGRGGRACAR